MAALQHLGDDGVLVPLRARDGSLRANAIIDAPDEARIQAYRWHLMAVGYARRTIYFASPKRFASRALHREVLELDPSDQRKVDHINGNKLDCRRSNLRFVTTAENAQNRQGANRGSASRYRGVTWSKERRKWVAGAMIDGKQIGLGAFDNEWDAALRAIEFRAAYMPWSRDADWLDDYRTTERALERLKFAEPRSEANALVVAEQIESLERHLIIQKANLVSPWLGMAAETALEHGDALKDGRA